MIEENIHFFGTSLLNAIIKWGLVLHRAKLYSEISDFSVIKYFKLATDQRRTH
jgi:hypothetical protein